MKIHAGQTLGLEGREPGERRNHLAPGAGWRRGQGPCGAGRQALLGPHLGRLRVIPLSAAHCAEQDGVGTPGTPSAWPRAARCPSRRWRNRPAGAWNIEIGGRKAAPPRRARGGPRPTTSGPMPSPGKRTMFAFMYGKRSGKPSHSGLGFALPRLRRQGELIAVGQRQPGGVEDVQPAPTVLQRRVSPSCQSIRTRVMARVPVLLFVIRTL